MKEESLAMELIRDSSKRNKRTFIALLIVIFLWFATILSFVWYINQFDFVTETVEQEVSDIDSSTINQTGIGK